MGGVESSGASGKLGFLRGRQWHVLSGQAVPELADEVEPFLRGEAGNIEYGGRLSNIARSGCRC